MKFNDPFGRMERRHQLGYESMRDSLRRGNIDTPEAAMELIKTSKQRALKLLGVGLLLFLVALIFMPNAMPLAFGLLLFLVVWVTTSTTNGKRYIQRYIDEELTK